MITPQNITQHELIGLEAEVVSSSNKANIGLKGSVVDETQKTLVLENMKGEKTVFKDRTKFVFELPSKTKVEVDGGLLNARPWDRIKRK